MCVQIVFWERTVRAALTERHLTTSSPLTHSHSIQITEDLLICCLGTIPLREIEVCL